MPVVQLNPEVLRIGHPAPVSVRDATGHLLLAKGVVVTSEEQRQKLVAHELFMDEIDGELLKRAIASKLDAMLRQNAKLGKIAGTQHEGVLHVPDSGKPSDDPITAWANLQMHARVLLQDPPPAEFPARLEKLQAEVLELVDADEELALLILVQIASTDAHHYSASHGLLVAVLAELTARQLPAFTPEWRRSLRCAALTMNIGMTALQDRLALQDEQPSAQQSALIEVHPPRAVACLREAGVTDDLWLAAVGQHHATKAGPLAEQAPSLQLARVMQRADIFAARLAMRRSRPAMAAAAALKAAYLDEHQQADEAGKALIQATGIYPPGSFVRLTSGELALVLRHGVNAKSPKVASLISKSGTPLMEPVVRDTRVRPHDVAAGIAPHEVRVRLPMVKMLTLAGRKA